MVKDTCENCTKMKRMGIIFICMEKSKPEHHIYEEVKPEYKCCKSIEFKHSGTFFKSERLY